MLINCQMVVIAAICAVIRGLSQCRVGTMKTDVLRDVAVRDIFLNPDNPLRVIKKISGRS